MNILSIQRTRFIECNCNGDDATGRALYIEYPTTESYTADFTSVQFEDLQYNNSDTTSVVHIVDVTDPVSHLDFASLRGYWESLLQTGLSFDSAAIFNDEDVDLTKHTLSDQHLLYLLSGTTLFREVDLSNIGERPNEEKEKENFIIIIIFFFFFFFNVSIYIINIAWRR